MASVSDKKEIMHMPAVFGQTFYQYTINWHIRWQLTVFFAFEFEIDLVWGSPCKYIETYLALNLTFEF